MTQSGQGGEPQYPSARPAHEGIVLPADGSAPIIPGVPAGPPQEPWAAETAPVGGSPWDDQWGPAQGPGVPPLPAAQPVGGVPQQPHQPAWGHRPAVAGGGYPQPYPEQPETYGQQPSYGAGHPGQDAYGQYAAPQDPHGQPGYDAQPQAAQPGYDHHVVQPGYDQQAAQSGYDRQYTAPGDPFGAPAPRHAAADADAEATALIPPYDPGAATQYIPPVPGGADAAATQYIPPVPTDPDAAATQYIPPVPTDPDAAATQYIPPVPATPTGLDEAATQYIPPVPGGPAGPPSEFDGLFRTQGGAPAGAPGGYGYPADAPGSTQQMPRIEEPVAPPRPHPGQQPPHQQPPHRQGPPPAPYRYEEEPEPRRAPVGLIAAGVLGLAVVGLGVGALMAGDGTKGNNNPATVSSDATRPGATKDAGEKPVDPARAQAVQLDKLLADSGGSRDTVIGAVDDIKGCDNLEQAADDLRDAAREREELITRLEELKIDQLPDHERLASALTKAWKYSASADKHYAEWAEQVDGSKKYCKNGKARSTSHTSAGNRASGNASKYKEQAAGLWNTIAVKYELTKRDKTQL
ncbi:hypothetical protein [Streptomyces sp. NPDC086023]|uniref:hypothetical protein n=1 Tax=Streptomyces sp. NPDC086023 TaxID=3365746 RepID=UPI0037D19D83